MAVTRRLSFWIILASLGLVGAGFALRLFPVAFPILAVDIDMSREEALDRARDLASRFQWGPEGYRQAASFTHLSPTFQTYMELEGGGLESLNRLVKDRALSLYAWRVRHFSPGKIQETEVRFRPDGQPYGFRVRLPDDAPGDALTSPEALELARSQAQETWDVDFGLYELLESSQEEKPQGRIDHTFVFQRSDLTLGEAHLRLRLVVAGNRLTEVTHLLHTPDAFVRRYQDTRNANEGIALAGMVVFLLLFLVVGGGLGAVRLLRERQFAWKAPVAWGGVVAGLMALGSVNSLPLAWMGYDTALPANVHVATVVVMAGLTFLAGTIFLALIFMVGEGLMRLGFPDQIQQWKVWAPGVRNSTPVLGRTAAPYLIVGMELGFVVAFYLLTTRYAGWWSPASSMAEPDLLATHFPWLTAVGTSLFAAFSEETIFRAIPIGAAAYLGRRHGRPALWIWGAVVLQALVFAASHANYPQQPAYARVVEIFPTYLMWGAICVFFGLVPSIIGHFLYDLVFFSLPLFAAETSGIWIDRGIVLAAGLLPLALVLWARLRHGAVPQIPEWALNRRWSPSSSSEPEGGEDGPWGGQSSRPSSEGEAGERISPAEALGPAPRSLPPVMAVAVGAFALLGIALWVGGLGPRDAFRLSQDRTQAEASARSALREQGFDLGPDWLALYSVTGSRGPDHQFVWRQAGEEAYQPLAGAYLSEPGWQIRFINFQVPPADRAETFGVTLSANGEVERISHVLPEERPGETLIEEEARELAVQALGSRLGLPPGAMGEVSAEESAHPERTDWTFTFAMSSDTTATPTTGVVYPLSEGEARAEVRIAGDQVADAFRYVYVPEEWERDWRADQSRRMLASLPPLAILLLLGLGTLILAAVRWARGSLDVGKVRVLSIVTGSLVLLTAANEWPSARSLFTTELSFSNQAAMALLGMGLAAVFIAMGVGMMGGLAHTWLGERPKPKGQGFYMGLGLGLGAVGIVAFGSSWARGGPPPWPSYEGVISFWPWLSTALGSIVGFVTITVGALLVLATLERLASTRWAWVGFLLAGLVGLALAPNPPLSPWWIWVGAGGGLALATGLFWRLGRRFGWSIVPGAMAAPVVLSGAEMIMARPFPGAGFGAALGIVALLLGARIWSRCF